MFPLSSFTKPTNPDQAQRSQEGDQVFTTFDQLQTWTTLLAVERKHLIKNCKLLA